VWLEFDVTLDRENYPCVLFSLKRTGDIECGAMAALRLLLGSSCLPSIERNVLRLLRSLSLTARRSQMGVMFSRGCDYVRICVDQVPVGAAPNFITSLGLPVNSALQRSLLLYPQLIHSIRIDFDIGAETSHVVGIEYYPDSWRRPYIGSPWQRFIDFLVQDRMCSPGRAAGLLQWPGYCVETIVWPRLFFRLLSHVKLTHGPSGTVRSKAYFGFSSCWLSDFAKRTCISSPAVPTSPD
jgi:hypothetical protein